MTTKESPDTARMRLMNPNRVYAAIKEVGSNAMPSGDL